MFAGSGVQPVVDQLSRDAGSLARTLAACLRVNAHPKLPVAWDALLVVSPEHGRVFREAGWDRARLLAELDGLLTLPADELVRGAGGMAEGVPESIAGRDAAQVPARRPPGGPRRRRGGPVQRASSAAGSAGRAGSVPVTREVRT